MKVAIISVNGRLKMAVNPTTRQVTDRPQQFEVQVQDDHGGFGLRILPLNEYVKDPVRIEVTGERFG